MEDDICGFGMHESELLEAGDGDRLKGRLVLAERALAALGPSASEAARGAALWEIADAAHGMGDDATADTVWGHALAMSGFRTCDEWPQLRRNHSLTLLWRGELIRCDPFARDDVEYARARGDADELVAALLTLAEVDVGLGRWDEAIVLAQEARGQCRDSDWLGMHRPGYELVALRLLGLALTGAGRSGDALAILDQAERRSVDWPTPERREILLAAAGALRAAGRTEEAVDRVMRARAWCERTIANQRAIGIDTEPLERELRALVIAWNLA